MAIIIIISGNDFDHKVRLNKSYIIGRSKSADITINDDMCSGKHIQIWPSKDGHVLVEDLGSTNGTVINESAMTLQTSLYVGDIVYIGDTRIYINKSSLNPEELKKLSSGSNQTQFTTIGLPDSETDGLKKARDAINKKRGRLPKEDSTPTIEDEFEKKSIAIDIDSGQSELIDKGENSSSSTSKIDNQPSIKKSSISIAEKVKGKSNLRGSYKGSEDDIELDESSGKTSMMQIESVKKGNSKKVSSKDKGSSNKKKNQEVKDDAGLVTKILNIFKK